MRLSFNTKREKRLSREEIYRRNYNISTSTNTSGSNRTSFEGARPQIKSNAKKEKETDSARLIEFVKDSHSTPNAPVTFYFNRKVPPQEMKSNLPEPRSDQLTDLENHHHRHGYTSMVSEQSSTQQVSNLFLRKYTS